MNDKIDNIQITMDGFSEILSEIMIEIRSLKKADDRESALTADLLNKIVQTIDESKKGVTGEELKAYTAAMITTMRQLQDKANNSFSEFLNEKIAQLETVSKQPSIVKNQYTIDFKSSKTFIAIIFLFFCIGGSLYFNYNQFRENKILKSNDIKYRYVQMKGRISYDSIVYLNKSYAERVQYRDSIKKDILEFESLIKQKIYNESINNRNEKENIQINKRLKELAK